MLARPFLLALTLAAVALSARRSDGAPPPPPGGSQEELARSHFVAGEEEYARGRWREALHEFELGYALSPRPEFLINFAQVRRKLGEYDAAERECRRYLATAPPPELAAQAQKMLGQIEEESAHAPQPPPPPSPSPPSPQPTSAPTPTSTAFTRLYVESPARPGKKPPAWIAPVIVAGALVVGGAITLGLVFGLPPHDTFKPAPLGTVDFR
jgi:hypothetical protein